VNYFLMGKISQFNVIEDFVRAIRIRDHINGNGSSTPYKLRRAGRIRDSIITNYSSTLYKLRQTGDVYNEDI
jgi:hypothetical protein